MAPTHTVHIQHDFGAPVDRVFEHLANHDNLAVLFAPAKVERVREGENDPNGVGSTRKLSFWGIAPFEETTTVIVPNERIEYEITKGSPMRDHHGTMSFSRLPNGGTHLDYTIVFGSAIPGVASVVAATLRRSIPRGLRKVDAVTGAASPG